MTYPNNKTVTRSYDSAGRWNGVTDWNATPVTYGYDPNGNIVSKVTPGGIVDLKIWDANDAMTSAGTGVYGGQVYAHWDYTRNLDSQVASSTRGSAAPVGTDQQYGYDTNTQLTDVSDATIPTNTTGLPRVWLTSDL